MIDHRYPITLPVALATSHGLPYDVMMSLTHAEMLDEINALTRSLRGLEVRIDALLIERSRFLDHIADLRMRHDRDLEGKDAMIADLENLLSRKEDGHQ